MPARSAPTGHAYIAARLVEPIATMITPTTATGRYIIPAAVFLVAKTFICGFLSLALVCGIVSYSDLDRHIRARCYELVAPEALAVAAFRDLDAVYFYRDVPLVADGGRVLGVLDIDSTEYSRFGECDRIGLERICTLVVREVLTK
jgi:hypothetical protein